MSLFVCKLGTPDGQIQFRDIEAANPIDLRTSLEEQGLFVFEVKKKPFQFLLDKGIKKNRIDNRSLLTFNQEMLVLLYADAGSQLPLPTQMLITFTTFLKRFFLLGIVLFIAGAVSFRNWAATEKGKYSVDCFKLKIPFLGNVFTKYSVASFTRTLATVLGSGIPVVESLRMSIGTLNNLFMEKKLFEAVKFIEEGGRISTAFERMGIMPPLALRMLAVGESTGSLEDMLVDISDYLEDELEERMQILTTAIEPAVMVVMGIVIGGIIITMYLPVFKIAGTVG